MLRTDIQVVNWSKQSTEISTKNALPSALAFAGISGLYKTSWEKYTGISVTKWQKGEVRKSFYELDRELYQRDPWKVKPVAKIVEQPDELTPIPIHQPTPIHHANPIQHVRPAVPDVKPKLKLKIKSKTGNDLTSPTTATPIQSAAQPVSGEIQGKKRRYTPEDAAHVIQRSWKRRRKR
jgi:hypothetical protein